MERGASVDSTTSVESASTLASFSSVGTRDSATSTADSCCAGGFASDVSGNVSSTSCETLYERRLRSRLAKVDCFPTSKNASSSSSSSSSAIAAHHLQHPLDHLELTQQQQHPQKPVVLHQPQWNCGVRSLSPLEEGPSVLGQGPGQQQAEKQQLFRESRPRQEHPYQVHSSPIHSSPQLQHYHHHQEHHQCQQLPHQAHQHQHQELRRHRSSSPKSPKSSDALIGQNHTQQDQHQSRLPLERKHSSPHHYQTQQSPQRLERKHSFSRHFQQQKQQQQQQQHLERKPSFTRHHQQQQCQQQKRFEPATHGSPKDHAKNSQHRPGLPHNMNRSANDLRQHDEYWADNPHPRVRLNTFSGSYVTCSSSPPSCQAVAHLSLNPKAHKRTTSLKKPRRKAFDIEELDEMRPRTSSLPTRNNVRRPNLQYLSPHPFPSSSSSPCGHDHDEFYTIRSFSTTSKGQLVNRGDSWRSRSTNSVLSSGSGSNTELTHLSEASSQCSLSREGSGELGNSGGTESPAPSAMPYRVLMLGSAGVGKSSLTEQFSTSEYLGTFGPSIDSYREKTVSLLIDGEESTVCFIDPIVDADSVTDQPIDGFVVVFRIDDRGTFAHATDLLYELRKVRQVDSAVILVANKCDLVRSREVSTEEAKSVAATYDCKYVETSVILNHNVDELLVGIVTQMRLLSENKKRSKKSRHGAAEESGCYARSKNLLSKIFRKYPISKSCENLYVL